MEIISYLNPTFNIEKSLELNKKQIPKNPKYFFTLINTIFLHLQSNETLPDWVKASQDLLRRTITRLKIGDLDECRHVVFDQDKNNLDVFIDISKKCKVILEKAFGFYNSPEGYFIDDEFSILAQDLENVSTIKSEFNNKKLKLAIQKSLREEKFVVKGRHFNSFEDLEQFLKEYGKDIRRLDLSELVESERLKDLIFYVPNLEYLNLSSTDISGNCLLGADLSHLKEIYLDFCENFLDKDLKVFEKSPLKTISFIGSKIDGSGLKQMNLSQVEKINFANCKNLRDKSLSAFKKSPLESINLSMSIQIDGSGFFLMNLSQVKKLNLSWCKNLIEKNLAAFNKSPLQIICLCWTSITGFGLLLMNLSQLKKIDLTFCTKLTDGNLIAFKRSPLKEIDFTFTEISGSGLLLMNLSKLRKVKFYGTKLIDEYLIAFQNSPLEELKLAATGITGSGFKQMELSHLRKLDLTACYNLNYEYLNAFKDSPLEIVNLRHCCVVTTAGCLLMNLSQLKKFNISGCWQLVKDLGIILPNRKYVITYDSRFATLNNELLIIQSLF